ncbi:N-carbamoyl-L-amino-acid hydrolase [[Clostridium] ultunense Esp]|uniref:N-carbamoyl-L-amino-acid hydrolase n=1 Tax=[Clostridium] ultunense Esp TaxID=1288971 RepID=M1ZE30_9FIRM|nr:Zn-dependent hydrolase [Schnuerera ultunensis]CCQ96534.1 N-carbamoyl-L-amino-acid hydrolase [[Clostridium] ultunense Esp]SHD76501.1 N-carbamoyl-L-amino-acid hydrolase [[Clostridium] ultunense Esp]
MESCIRRIENDIENITKITATPQMGCTRFSYSKEDKQVREYLLKELEGLRLKIKIDGVGNIRAKYVDGNEDKPSIMFGSHIDTVANGGKFDGLTGVISALEVMRVIKENNLSLKNPVELIIFAEEEGSNFGITMLGSKVLTGKYGLEDLKKIENDEGISSYEIMRNFGLDVENIGNDVLKKDEVKAMIELHVEQGGILDSEKIPIGIVKAIAGMKTYKVSLKGVSNHAGSTPMDLRNDPMVGASEIVTYLEKVAKEKGLPSTVATVGKIHCQPNMPNVISGEVDFYVDIRDVEADGVETVVKELEKKTEEIVLKRGLKAQIELVGESDSVRLSTKVIEAIEKSALEKGFEYKIMNSGAVHDSAMLTELTEVGMIFVPSINGRSHCPEELTDLQDIKLGCDLLLNTVIRLANE